MIARIVVLISILAQANLTFAQSDVADAAMQRQTEQVRRLLEDGVDVNRGQADGATALHWAVYHGDTDLVSLLLEAGADPSAANRNGSTPLWLAASVGDAAIIDKLLQGGADANEALPLGRRPLMLAARSGGVEAVRVLLDHGADPNAKEEERGTNALMQAADQGHPDVIALLIEHGADVASVSAPVVRGGRTAALGKSNDPRASVRRQVIDVLCEAESPDIATLRAVSARSSGATEDALLAEAAEAELTTDDLCPEERRRGGLAAFGFGGGDDESDDDTTSAGADGSDTVSGTDSADDATGNQQQAAVNSFFGRRGRAREPDGGELTPLVYAARSGSIEAARVLLDAGADVNQLTRYGWSPLLAATQNRNYQMGKFLIKH
ncbi:MAG: ankyrin repeat domain-containing protein [Gammaproteobacteria bacterium]